MKAFGLAEVIAVISEYGEGYLLFGMRSLFLRSVCGLCYIENEARSDSCTRGCVRDGSDHSIRFPV